MFFLLAINHFAGLGGTKASLVEPGHLRSAMPCQILETSMSRGHLRSAFHGSGQGQGPHMASPAFATEQEFLRSKSSCGKRVAALALARSQKPSHLSAQHMCHGSGQGQGPHRASPAFSTCARTLTVCAASLLGSGPNQLEEDRAEGSPAPGCAIVGAPWAP